MSDLRRRTGPLIRAKLALTGVGYLAAWRLTRLAPERAVRRVFDAMSERSWRRNDRRRGIVRDNLAPIVGDGSGLDDVVHEAFLSYGSYWLETFRMQDLTSDELAERFG